MIRLMLKRLTKVNQVIVPLRNCVI